MSKKPRLFKKVLVANRGEVALRVIRACKELDIRTVAVYSEADASSLHVQFADEHVCIGPPPSNLSYLNIPQIITAAEITDADAIHPGYGFLSENAQFSEICEQCRISFIGPTPEIITRMGDKAEAKRTMQAAGVPTVPGSDGEIHSVEEAQEIAQKIGYPVIVKASGGGGGRGMRVAHTPMSLGPAYSMAQSEAEKAFGNPALYLEKYFENPRHIEFQIMGDKYGNVIHFGERDCSIQRRHQKLVEESPSPALTPEMREQMGEIACRAAKAVGYTGAGTIEFLFNDGKFYFMEMNTRIQVEHPVTEMVTNLDLVKEQIRVAAGHKLRREQRQCGLRGHAIEVRVNAEDPERGFMPSPGRIVTFHPPGGPGVRLDSHVYEEYTIPPYYDSLIAKLIIHASTRENCIARLRRALDEFVIEGVKTTLPFYKRLCRNMRFIEGVYDTQFVEQFWK
ncbi:acetyl-CoA carboxylase biotin carboxylase subunit [Candidatus Sumerlaeota bacterium]|nr:acetyl-CoA carboxylase biotin carboxylase subunit [Candidatus Sumerlaeota bacterium]